jgi:aldehyde dehydrogenase
MTISQDLVAEITKEVVARLQAQIQQPAATNSGVSAIRDGVFPTVDDAVKGAAAAQLKVAQMSVADRGKAVAIIKRMCEENADDWGRQEFNETQIGRVDHKIEKLKIVKLVLGVEAMRSDVRADTTGLCLIERAPWGVIGMALPATHSVPTMASNAINVIASGNTAVFCPHPAGAKCAAMALRAFNLAIEREVGVANMITTMADPTIKSAEELFHHPGVALLCVTGGPFVVKAALKSGKRVIAAGPGNPPVLVDETADLNNAAKSIIAGSSFDNNLLCIGEKEVFVVSSVFDAFRAAMKKNGGFELDAAAVERLSEAAFKFDGPGKGCGRAHLKRDLVGKNVSDLAAAAGVQVPAGIDLLFGETKADHAFVVEEQMMPFIPIVRVPNADAGIAAAVEAEHGYRHTAIVHSQNMDVVTRMARAMNTTLFVQNAPCTAALGTDSPGYLSFSIATPTGEGITTPLTFTRERQIVLGRGALRII